MRYSAVDKIWYASLSIDCGWLKRSSGRKYDSDEGHSILVGNFSRLVVAIHAMSRVCHKCENGKVRYSYPYRYGQVWCWIYSWRLLNLNVRNVLWSLHVN